MLKRVLFAVAALLGIAITAALGFWQWDRAQQKLGLQAAIERQRAQPALETGALLARTGALQAELHRPVQLHGEWVARHIVYLDNRQMNGRPGFYVLTPLRLAGSDRVVLVQRGWVPRDFQLRTRLPEVQTPTGEVQVRGRLAPPPAQLLSFVEEERGPIRQNLDLDRFRAETGLPLLALSVQQTGEASQGLLREWPQAAVSAGKNYGYAFQWWALAGLIALLYVWFQFVVPRRQSRRS